MTFDEWEKSVPAVIRSDSLWKMEAYRLGLFMSDLAWNDIQTLGRDRRLISTADQLYRATGNISSNVGEGYSRGTGRDRARFYEYALGSARESRDWYYKVRNALSPKVVSHRLETASKVIRLLLTMVANERKTNRRIDPKDDD